jgi:AraC-like DNA-binding protein
MTQLILHSIETRSSSELFLDYFRLLFCAHVATKYDSSPCTARKHRGGLGRWQRRRATELIAEHLQGSIRLSTLARECGLSTSHFARAFRQSFGTSAHRYLVQRRIEKAKELLSFGDCSLSEVALLTGFADQAAFSRTFKTLVASTPGRWRRDYGHRRPSIRVAGTASGPHPTLASTDLRTEPS